MYGATNTERYRVLHAVADALVERLGREYDVVVERSENAAAVTPVGDGAAIRIEYSDFPGLKLTYGDAVFEAYPHCGCDYCDEDPALLEDELVRHVEAVVAGGFGERGEDHWFDGGNWASGTSRLDDDAPYPAWTRR